MALASVSDIVKAEGVNYLRRVLNVFGFLFAGKGQRQVIYVSEACAGPGMGHIFCIIFTVGTL